jgi:hypothetical protein
MEFLIYLTLPATLEQVTEVNSASNRYEYQETYCGVCVKGRGAARKADWPRRHLWADCIENVRTSTSNTDMDLHSLLQKLFYFYLYLIKMLLKFFL